MRLNPINKAAIMKGGGNDAKNKEKAIENIEKGLDQVEQGFISPYLGSTRPSVLFKQLMNADPSPEKVYTLWLSQAFSKDPQTTLDDLDKATEALAIIYDVQNQPRTPTWAQSLPTRRQSTIAKLREYMSEKGVLKKRLIASSAWEKLLKKMIDEGEAQVIIQSDDVIFIDEITKKAAQTLGGKKPEKEIKKLPKYPNHNKGDEYWTDWCTGRGAFDTYKMSGLFIMYPMGSGAQGMVQISATEDEGIDENGQFHEAKDITDSEIDWDDYPVEWLDLAKEAQKIVQQRVKALSTSLPIFEYLKNPNARKFQVLKQYYQGMSLLPLDYIDQNRSEIVAFFNDTSMSESELKSSMKRLSKTINYEMLMVHVFVNGFENIPLGLLNLKMKDIPGGIHQFQDEKVILDPFEMNAYETTNALWLYVMGLDAFTDKKIWSDFTPLSAPKVYVSWYDCIAFCNKMSVQAGLQPCYEIDGTNVDWIWDANGFRLPSEAEWEAAARARSDYIYAGSNIPKEVAWYSDNSDSRVHKVGQLKPNGYGLYDMSGNVSEWVYDSWGTVDDKEEQPLRDPTLAAKYKNPRRKRNG